MKIIIDSDPGQDDVINLLLAMSSPEELDILGLTAVAGNVPLDLTQRNTRIVCEMAQRTDLKVYAGCERPMVRDLVTAEYVHGESGIDGFAVYEPEHPLEQQHAVDYIVETLRAADEDSITLVPTGPLTNIAAALVKDPSIATKVHNIVLMGGAMREGGNCTPSAEFNIYVDPHAAQVVFDCGRPLTIMGLDVTHQVLVTQERVQRIRDIGTKVALDAADLLDFFDRHDTQKYKSSGAPLHDPCTIAYLLQPELFAGKQCNVSVETESELTMGHTAVDFWRVTEKPHNANWIHQVDAEGFFDLLTARLSRFVN
jgi:purine nucleosidase